MSLKEKLKKGELTEEQLDKVKAGMPYEKNKRKKFLESIGVSNDELTLEQLDEVKAGQDNVVEEER